MALLPRSSTFNNRLGEIRNVKKIVKFGLVSTLALGLVGCSNMTKEEYDKANLDRV
jgi:hypothetical protein